MNIGLKVALIIFVMGIGCLFFGDVWATEKHIANKPVARKNAARPAANKSAAVHAKKQRAAKIVKPIPSEPVRYPDKLSVQSGAVLVIEQHTGGVRFSRKMPTRLCQLPLLPN